MLKLLFKSSIAIALAVLLGGCATDRSYGAAVDIEVTDLTQLPMPQYAQSAALRPFDSLEIVVVQDASLSGTYFVDGDGGLAFPYLGQVDAVGLSPSELAAQLKSGLSRGYIIDPQLTVRPSELRELNVSLGGEVNTPGNYPVNAAPTLLRGVNVAGGVTEFAKDDDVLILREIGGQKYIGAFNLGAIQRGNYPDPQLAPGDIVMVGDSPAQRRLQRILPYLSILTTGAILLDRTGN